jgi:hypothetical protein
MNKIQKWDAFITVGTYFVVWSGMNSPNVKRISGSGLVGRNKWLL